ncbi:hypothetical protein MA16_Dca024660 [Dendrobium catenatum]|uniref:Protein PLASTID REDOX INSENSITIVE 2, chloroplastic n=1 Tax=Dendrobium catenatum TaxID=906689 RepID=A0A2I0VBM6_9ASPA|nr:hypothetical protein MA16_Dca024660 [Dendrobium catenatum]
MACQSPLSTSYRFSCACKSYHSAVPSTPSPLLSRHTVFSCSRVFSPPSDRSSNVSLTLKLGHSYPHRTSKAPLSSARIPFKAVEYETSKFRAHLLERLSKKDIFDDSLEEIVRICTEVSDSLLIKLLTISIHWQILSNFLHTEYGGPGTLLVVPFIDMADTINERGLPGGPQAARAAVLWAQKHIDKDWKDWTGDPNL